MLVLIFIFNQSESSFKYSWPEIVTSGDASYCLLFILPDIFGAMIADNNKLVYRLLAAAVY